MIIVTSVLCVSILVSVDSGLFPDLSCREGWCPVVKLPVSGSVSAPCCTCQAVCRGSCSSVCSVEPSASATPRLWLGNLTGVFSTGSCLCCLFRSAARCCWVVCLFPCPLTVASRELTCAVPTGRCDDAAEGQAATRSCCPAPHKRKCQHRIGLLDRSPVFLEKRRFLGDCHSEDGCGAHVS